MIKEGMIIEGPFWREPVEIKKIEEFAGRIHIIGATIYSNEHIDQLIPKEEIEKLKTREFVLDFTTKGSEAFLSIEATRFRLASLFDPLLAMNTSKIDPLPFQIEAVYGYILKDVSKENLGFDIRSKGDLPAQAGGETRYIEVKARKDEGQIALTLNEWFKAKRFKEHYWLYVVANAVKNPILYIINNPTENLKVQEKVEVVRFVVPLEEWKNKGVKV